MRARFSLLLIALALSLPLAGCLGPDAPATTVPPPGAFEDEIPAARGNGSFEGETRAVRLAWENGNANYATVNITLALTQGSVTVRVLDGNGFPVFDRAFTGESEGTITTGRGVPGRWAVVLDADDAKGDWRIVAQPL